MVGARLWRLAAVGMRLMREDRAGAMLWRLLTALFWAPSDRRELSWLADSVPSVARCVSAILSVCGRELQRTRV